MQALAVEQHVAHHHAQVRPVHERRPNRIAPQPRVRKRQQVTLLPVPGVVARPRDGLRGRRRGGCCRLYKCEPRPSVSTGTELGLDLLTKPRAYFRAMPPFYEAIAISSQVGNAFDP